MSVSENDKRWLVVLVATDKIVAPLLRDFVAKGIDKLKDFLNDHLQNISTGYTLETMTYLLCHPPPPASPDPYLKYLKFQNINNNEGLSKVNYNYSVNNVVDLAKLYLPGYLAKFAAFDNSMDMSAALRLLGYNDYPTQVFVSSNPFLDIKSLADDVRNTVRNPGAHYNESIWTDLFMNQCFEKLVALVKAFVLPADQEKDALDQLHRWKSNGWKLIIAKDLSDLMETLLQNRDVNIDSPETRRRLNILVTLLDRCDSVEERVSLTEEQLSLTEERVSLTEEHLGLVKERQDELQRLVEEVIENLKENRVNQISGAHGQLEVPAVTTSSPFSRTSVVSADDLSEEASHMNKESGDETSESSSSSGVSENCIDSSGVNPPTSPFSRTSVVSADDLRGEASHMNEESGDEACEGSTSSGVSENCIDSFGEDLPENQPHVERINPDIVLLQRQNGAPFKIEFTGKLPEGMESGVADFENLRTGVEIVKMGVKTLVGAALPYSSRQGAFKVTVFSQNREKCLGETKVVYIDLIGAALEKAVTCPETMRKFIQAAIPCLNEHSEGDTCDAENLTNSGPSGREKSSLSVQLLQRFIYAAAKINSVWFIRLIFELPAGRIAFDSYKGRPLLPEYVARARGHNEIAVYLRDVTKRYSESEITDEEKLRAINWQEIVTAIEATQENPNLSREGAFKVTVSSHNREKCLEETKVADIELIEETLKQAISYPNTMLKFIQAAIPRLNEHSEGGTSDAENHTNGGRWEKSLLSLQLLQKFIYAAAKVNAVWFIRLIFDLPAGRIAFDSYKGRPLLPEYVARARGHNEIAEYLEDVTKRYSEIERTDEEKFDAINWQEIVTAIEATQENPSTRVVRGQDWEWGNQDGGKGFVGTVAQVGKDKKSPATAQLVYVQWDRGGKHDYRAGKQGKHDLRVFCLTNGDAKHLFTSCDGCKKDPINGLRWHCLDCPSYDLCSKCYMNDVHDVNHRFERFDKSRARGICVGKRQGATKLEARGMFKGAKVTRGPDWEWKELENLPPMEGEVTEITSWNDETINDAVRVNWKKGPKGNIYRLGTNGKVDLKCTSPAVGGSYYRDHLPPLTMLIRKSQSGFTTGDKVYLQKLAVEKLQELCAGHGGWNADMERYIAKIGVVQDFTTNGDVAVEYRDTRWRYNPAALTKMQKFKQGDEVLVKSDENLVKELQKEHGGWNESMISILGRTGKVLKVDSDGDVLVSEEGTRWMLSPAAVTSVTDPEPQQLTEAGDVGNEDPSGLFSLFRDFLRQAQEQEDPGLVIAAQSNNLSRLREILDANPERIDELEGGHTALHVACHQGHCEIIRELLERGANMDVLDNQGYTAMHQSTYQDESGEALKLLLERGFDPNVQHRINRSTPLHLAVKRKNETAVQILTQCSECDVNLQDEAGDTPLHDAILAEHHNMVDMLLDCPRVCYTLCNRKGFNYLQHAVFKGNKRAVERIFAKTGNSLNVVKDDGFTTLHIAAINDHREIAKILLTKPECEVDAVTAKNQPAIHLAANEGYSVMVGMLLDHGANVNSVDDNGDTALHITLTKEHALPRNLGSGLEFLFGVRKSSASFVAVSRCLLSHGADVLKVNGSGKTPLDMCQGSEVEQLIRKIAAGGGTTHDKKVPSFGSSSGSQTDPELGVALSSANAATQADIGLVNAVQSNNLSRVKEILDTNPELINKLVGGHTALHTACRQGHCDIIRELLERGANMNIRDNQGYTAMHHSTYQDESGEALKLLLERGFDPNVQHGSNKSTPLHSAVQKKNETAVQILTQCPECDVNLQDQAGDTPLYDAILAQHHSMVDMLLDCPRICYTLCNGKGFNYLQYAVLKGNKRAVERIFAKTENSLNVTEDDGFTTLHIAAINNHLEIAKILLQKPGCEVNTPTAENQSALHLAANEGYSVMVELLLDHGANVNAVDNDGDTVLHITLMKEHALQRKMGLMPGLELLLGERKNSASFVAVSRCLLSYGADVLKVNGSGKTPLDVCRGSEVEQLIRKIAAGGGTTQNKKVPSFGSVSGSQTEPELGDASSSASAATLTGETEKDDENQTDSTSSTDEAEDTFLRRLIGDLWSVDQQESVSQETSDEMECEDVQEGERAKSVPKETAMVENTMVEDKLCQENVVLGVTNKVEVETWASDISNNSVLQPAEMAENNTDADMDDRKGPPSQTQSADDDVNMDQETENEEKNPSTSDDLKVLCNICEEAEAVVAFKPCGHTVVCTECAARLKRCLDCKTPITGKGTRDGNPIIGMNNKSLLSRYQQLEAKFRKLEEFVVCCICVERKKDVIFRCGHGTCQFCAKQLSICHICQKPIEMKIQMF